MSQRVQQGISFLKSLGPVARTGSRNARRALSLMTRLPVSVDWDPAQPWGQFAGWFPFAGFIIGMILLLAAIGWDSVADPSMVGSALLLAVWVLLTGGLHLDGVGDCWDAFFAPVTPERRLEIMKDPHIGSFGVIGLILVLLVKYSAIGFVMTRLMGAVDPGRQVAVLWPLVVAPVAGRAALCALLSVPWIPLARPGGMGARVRDGFGRYQLLGAALTALVVAAAGGWKGLFMLGAALAAAAGAAWLAWRRIGGLTGDVLGATVETAEAAALAVATLAAFN